ncbi:MAG: molybdenum cofactor biosynthesis protein MoaE [Anaerolineae bacterium]
MQITVLLFATLKDKAGTNRLTLDLPSDQSTVNEVRAALHQQFPAIAPHLERSVSAINQEFAFPDDPIKPGDEVAFFPPVSGGSGTEEVELAFPEIFQIANAPIDLNQLVSAITVPSTGAVCFFTGMVRGETHTAEGPLRTDHLEYEAYESMALAKLRQVAAEIRQQFPGVQGMALVQRIGVLQVGEPTVLIACASAHRHSGCFEAAQYGINRLKEIVPVWKKEVRLEASEWIEGKYYPNPADRQE